jgi:hypothetical protein
MANLMPSRVAWSTFCSPLPLLIHTKTEYVEATKLSAIAV